MKVEFKNARIVRTTLGEESHGIMSCCLTLDYGGSGQGFGNYALDAPVKDDSGKFIGRVGTAFGMQFIMRVLKVVGVSEWEALPGKHVRVRATDERVEAIGHITDDRWFVPSALAAEMKGEERG